MTRIRRATIRDLDAVRDIHLSAFPEEERRIVATLAANLVREETEHDVISLVAETDSEIIGHVAFSPATIDIDRSWKGYILAPLGVMPEYQQHGIGSALIRNGIELLSGKGAHVLFVYGDPDYYSRFEFDADSTTRYLPPFALQYPFGWQTVTLNVHTLPPGTGKITCIALLNDPTLW